MSSTLRRLSTSLPFISKTTSNSTDSDPSTSQSSSPPSNSFFRRKSSSAASSAEDTENGSYRALGSRDYKLAVDPEEEKMTRRSSVAEMAEMMGGSGTGSGEEEGQKERERKGSKGRIYGARDWRLIGKD